MAALVGGRDLEEEETRAAGLVDERTRDVDAAADPGVRRVRPKEDLRDVARDAELRRGRRAREAFRFEEAAGNRGDLRAVGGAGKAHRDVRADSGHRGGERGRGGEEPHGLPHLGEHEVLGRDGACVEADAEVAAEPAKGRHCALVELADGAAGFEGANERHGLGQEIDRSDRTASKTVREPLDRRGDAGVAGDERLDREPPRKVLAHGALAHPQPIRDFQLGKAPFRERGNEQRAEGRGDGFGNDLVRQTHGRGAGERGLFPWNAGAGPSDRIQPIDPPGRWPARERAAGPLAMRSIRSLGMVGRPTRQFNTPSRTLIAPPSLASSMSRAGALLLLATLLAAAGASALPGVAPAQAPVFSLVANPVAGEYLVHRNADVEERLRAVETEFPDIASVASIGKTVLMQDLWSITLASPNGTGRYHVYIDGGHHGNEYMGVEMAMLYLGHLVEGWRAGDPTVTAFLDEHTVMIVPIVNPDGNLLDTRKNANQVDLNRNYPFKWGGEGSGATPAEPNYRGPSALSEPESAANWAAALAFDPDIWVTTHTGISEFYWPWGWTHDPSPDDAMFVGLEKPFEDATNGRVDAMQGAELYIVTGANDDSAYGMLGVPGFTFEVHEDQNVPAYPETIPVALAEQLAGLVWITEHTKHLGANVRATTGREGDALVATLANEGWGVARNVSVRLTSGSSVVATRTIDVPAGGTARVSFEGAPADASIGGSYPRLFVNTTPVWDLEVAGTVGGSDAGILSPVPSPALVAILAVGALGALVARRR